MAASDSVNPVELVREQLASASPDLLQAMVKTFAEALMSAEADAICGAPYGQRSEERTNQRNGYRAREWDTRVGTVELAIPKLRQGSYFPDWLLAHRRRRAEQALVSVVATSYLLGVSTRRVEKLVEQLGVAQLSKSQVSEMASYLDAQVETFRNRPLDAGHYTFRVGRRAGGQGPRRWSDGQRTRAGRGRRQRRRAPGGARPGRGRQRGRRRLVGVPALAVRPRPERGSPGDLRCPPRAGGCDRRHVARCIVAAVPYPLPA